MTSRPSAPSQDEIDTAIRARRQGQHWGLVASAISTLVVLGVLVVLQDIALFVLALGSMMIGWVLYATLNHAEMNDIERSLWRDRLPRMDPETVLHLRDAKDTSKLGRDTIQQWLNRPRRDFMAPKE
jgi:hypothetical protein